MSEFSVIEIKNLNFSYDGFPVLENVNLSIDQHDFACIIGPNGGGKTTLLKLMLGILKPSGGELKILGETPAKCRQRIGYVSQNFLYDPSFPMEVLDLVLMGRLGASPGIGPYKRRDKDAAIDILKELELYDLRHRHLATLSGGQRQRALVARALVTEPEILLLDEPASGMDISVQEDFFNLLHDLTKKLTVVMVTHDVGFVSTFVDRVICVNRTVVIHPTNELTGEVIQRLYGTDMRLVRHDHRCAEDGHQWPNS
jgi:zinc transport system ATP-binding protein